jgi:maltose alpha-D-glucosyltransferase/alpha-amylase
MMPGFLRRRRWYLGLSRTVRLIGVLDIVKLPESSAYLLFMQIQYNQGEPDTYTLPLSVARGDKAEDVSHRFHDFILARLQHPDGSTGVLYSALRDPEFGISLLNAIAKRRRAKANTGELAAAHTPAFREIWGSDRPQLEPSPVHGDHNHSALTFGDRFFLKLFRKIEAGRNPELEVEQFLSGQLKFPSVPRLAGWIEYRAEGKEPSVLGILENRVQFEATGWQYTMDNLSLFFERALARREDADPLQITEAFPLSLRVETPPAAAGELLGDYLEMVKLLGRRTAEMHMALASRPDDPVFAPEPFTDFYRHSLYHGMLALEMRAFETLRNTLSLLPPDAQAEAEALLQREADVRSRLQLVRDRRIKATRIRHHGDYHLGQVLHTGKDFIIIDLEGDPNQATGDRRIKRSPLRDVACMLRSLHYAAHSAIFGQIPGVIARPEDEKVLRGWAEFWTHWVNALFLTGYLDVADRAELLPATVDDLRVLLQCYLLERALTELQHDLTKRLAWARIPIHGITEILDSK